MDETWSIFLGSEFSLRKPTGFLMLSNVHKPGLGLCQDNSLGLACFFIPFCFIFTLFLYPMPALGPSQPVYTATCCIIVDAQVNMVLGTPWQSSMAFLVVLKRGCQRLTKFLFPPSQNVSEQNGEIKAINVFLHQQ